MHSNNTDAIPEILKIKHKTFTAKSFKYAAPTTWKSFPKQIRTCNNLARFEPLLKTYLYKEAFNTK